MKFSTKTQALYELIAPAVAACGVDLWGIEFLPQGKRSLLRIYIDKPLAGHTDDMVAANNTSPEDIAAEVDVDDADAGRGIGVEDCVKVTHQVSGVLDVHDPIAGEYALEVSSPGWDRPFFSLNQMQAYIGQAIALRLISAVENRRKLTATLLDVSDQGITVEVEGQQLVIDGDNIDKANLIYQD
ncbi:ribosome maturation factor RimP [Alkanindiges sp. WGS2144]|uniref:ribosome maturation factor RimP n=1 Tax=Alkanindiges sp. WGS2144 TaxID=3366808 RepID=UPI0037530ACE